jgi:hypothetical protein
MYDVFLSYSGYDTIFASHLAADLNHNGISVWIDYLVEPGDDWSKVVSKRVDESMVFVPILSAGFVQSKHCTLELRYAHDMGHSIIPVSLHPIPYDELPIGFSADQSIDFQEWQNSDRYRHKLQVLLTRAQNTIYHSDRMERRTGSSNLYESLVASNSNVEQPNYDALEIREHGSKVGESKKKRFQALERWQARYKNANWFQWESEKWEAYLKHCELKRQLRGDLYEEHKFERVIHEYGHWILRHSELSEEKRLERIDCLLALHVVYWQFGKQEPPELVLQD